MTEHDPLPRRERRALERETAHDPASSRRRSRDGARLRAERDARIRKVAFGGIAIAVLAIGAVLAFGDFLGRPGGADRRGAIDVQSSMAGFTPTEIRVQAGETVTMNFWTDDAAVHLQGGVHTMVVHGLGLYEELPGRGHPDRRLDGARQARHL